MTHHLPSDHPAIKSGEFSLALAWYNSLSFQQQEFLSTYYGVPVAASEYAILIAFRDRDTTHNHCNWPASVFRSI